MLCRYACLLTVTTRVSLMNLPFTTPNHRPFSEYYRTLRLTTRNSLHFASNRTFLIILFLLTIYSLFSMSIILDSPHFIVKLLLGLIFVLCITNRL